MVIMNESPVAVEQPGHRKYTAMNQESEAAVGRIAIWAGWLEQVLADLCAELINGNNWATGYTLIANMSASSMIETAKKLVKESPTIGTELRDATVAALVGAKATLEVRNRILHSAVGGSFVEGKAAFHNSRRKKVKDGPRLGEIEGSHLGLAELDKIGEDLYVAVNTIADCQWEIADYRQKYSKK